jgi:hypothetical protein
MISWPNGTEAFLLSLVGGTVGAFVTNYFGAFFSLRRFRKEQWWLERRDAYDSIIKRLADIKFNSERQIMAGISQGEYVLPKAPESVDASGWSLQEAASAGGYLISQETAEAIRRVLDAQASCGDLNEEFERTRREATAALKIVRAEAHHDLKVKKNWLVRSIQSVAGRNFYVRQRSK